MLRIDGLTKRYGNRTAVDHISFHVSRGSVVGFLGPNGAGKTTALRMIAGALAADAGTVTIDGVSIDDAPLVAKAKVGFMPEHVPLYVEMRVVEFLRFRAEVKRVAPRDRNGAVDRAIADAQIADVADVRIETLSKGYRQRVGLADALVGDPPLLLLDEPTASLDPNQISQVRLLIRKLGLTRMVLLSTHVLSEVEAVCDRAVLISRGKIVADGPISDVTARHQAGAYLLRVRGDADRTRVVAASVETLGTVNITPTVDGIVTLHVTFERGAVFEREIERLVATLVGGGIGVVEVRPVQSPLEHVFAELTRDGAS
jgi:ABC-2 type transport system ATP-binding protein